ncbi:MAG: hypothetical protein WCX84_08590 [Syntrophales bacterium]|jgi:hypothetical protein|nr:hypothetical protein [Syntrophales bacterium]NLN59389.1 hypothetical protein [Deltaproteobacteria bacterium]
MDAVAYPDHAVSEFVNTNLIPLRISSVDHELAVEYRIKWTPSLLILDAKGVEHNRTLGFFWPQELIPSLLLGMGKAYFNKSDRVKAAAYFGRILAEFPKSFQTPEAVYMKGVSDYLATKNAADLIGIHDRLSAEFPESQWAMRANPYSFLK